MQKTDFTALAVDELNRADMWANKDSQTLDADLRKRMVEHSLQRAQIYALLNIGAQLRRAADHG